MSQFHFVPILFKQVHAWYQFIHSNVMKEMSLMSVSNAL